MTPQNFCYWLQGFFEISGTTATTLNQEQIKMIKSHLRLVFRDSIDPSMGDQQHQDVLNSLHQGVSTAQFTNQHEPFGGYGTLERC